ncbi:TIGR04211 family SH3 domain-containing protein [Psychromonas sp. PT13]|uniref:TIGR04211 family SH3 domain-containing protein n=1 Tax=Psychromonas sp. PT13 TaxID=3439547 RepID=UPI003EB8F9A2
MKLFNYILSTLTLIFCVNAFAATRYVSEDIYTYLHSGPSLDYRIIGTVKVGSKLTTLKYDSNTKFMQVRTDKGKTGWVKNSELQEELPSAALLPQVQKELLEAQTRLKNIDSENARTQQENIQSITDKENLIAKLQSEKKFLEENMEKLKAKNLELDLLQDTKDERVKMEWMMYGGSVLVFGLLIGLIIPFLPRRKKRRDNW